VEEIYPIPGNNVTVPSKSAYVLIKKWFRFRRKVFGDIGGKREILSVFKWCK
jgi:hypothetical protein